MKNLIKILALTLLVAVTVKATPIVGEITFNGGTIVLGDSANNITTNVTSATQILGYTGPQSVNTTSGHYVGATGSVTFSTFKFSDSGVLPLWTLSVGPTTYSFDATNIVNNSFISGGSNFLNLSGSGIAHITGLTSSVGIWSLTSTSTSTKFTFGATTSVPDAASTVVLIGLGLLAIGFAARGKRRAA